MRTLHASLFGPTGRPDCFRTGPPCALHGTGGPDCPRDSRSLGQPVALAPPDLRQPSAWCPHTRHPPRSSRALTAGPGTRPVACVYKSSEPTASHDQSRTVTDSHGQSRLVEAMEYRPVSGSPSRSSAESPSHDFAALEAAGPAHAVCLVGLATSPCPWPAKSGSWHCAGLTPGAEPTRGFPSRRPPPPASPASAGYGSRRFITSSIPSALACASDITKDINASRAQRARTGLCWPRSVHRTTLAGMAYPCRAQARRPSYRLGFRHPRSLVLGPKGLSGQSGLRRPRSLVSTPLVSCTQPLPRRPPAAAPALAKKRLRQPAVDDTRRASSWPTPPSSLEPGRHSRRS